jgi:DNA-binding response OmpR family regulator
MSEALHASPAKARVLIVEDEPQMCELLGEIVGDEGFHPHCVRSDRAAYAALRGDLREHCACMIVDVNLGAGTTGYDVARFARRLQPQLPVIYVSGQTTEVSYQANGVPGSLFVPKPFTPGELMEQVHKLVGDNDDRGPG